ncbi:sigma-70 family RNA polymerase sigma factor [Thomasclavelia spiroformis]|uniref:sigma-70 family RNA polymerase sigma factor n=1 Tax=Thomasclavelia spiroformis TaxID=29348 RepID=UPI00241DCFA0|nr:sigma-70 family RNA polymerase sigma factor [Thomasclavelia spiroformis]MBS6686228.1 sigma-70 family RNA polymerase sigma factor [Thomasclavelia spiroformis]
MKYNYKNEYKKWYAWKEKEEETLRALNVSQALINQLRDYDYEQFKADRRYKTRHLLFDDNFFINRAIYDKKQYLSLNDLLDDIENEALYEYLKNSDEKILKIITLKIQGYSIREISKITGLTTNQIYKRIKKLKKVL